MVDAGWYDDPNDASQFAYWDGTNWTGQTHPKPEPTPAPIPAPAPSGWATPVPPEPAAPSAWGAPAAPQPAAWGSPAPAAAAPQYQRRVEPASRGRKAPVKMIVLLLVLVIGGGAAFVLTRGDDAEPVAVADVMAALGNHGVTCADDEPTLTPSEASEEATDMPAHFATESGTMTQRQSANLISAADEVSKIAADLPEKAAYAFPQCGNSWVLVDADTAYLVVLGPNAQEAESDLEDLGVKIRPL